MLDIPVALIFTPVILFLGAIILIRLYRKRFSSIDSWLLFIAPSALGALALYFIAPWPYIDIYLRWVFLALYVLGLFLSVKRLRGLPLRAAQRHKAPRLGMRFILLCLAVVLLYGYITGYAYNKDKAVELQFPFRNGSYYMMQAGGSRVTNFAHRNFSPNTYGYAMDIAKLNSWGSRIKGFVHSARLSDYEIYLDTVYSPCDGRVIQVVNTVENNPIGKYNTRQVHGNHIILQADGYRVFMAHFQKGTILVHLGQRVRTGQPLGVVGNAGFTSEPHLHLNVLKDYKPHTLTAEDTTEASHKTLKEVSGKYIEYPYDGFSVPCLFKGKLYSINDVIKAPER